MVKKVLIGFLIVIGIAVTVMNHLLMGILAVGVWIYLFVMVRKQKRIELNGQMESRISEWHLKRIKAFSIVAVFSFLVFIVSAAMHNVLHARYEIEDAVFSIVSIVACLVFVAATAGRLVVFLKGRQ